MTHTEASQALLRAAKLGSQARRAGRWYVGYLIAFAAGSFLFAALFGFVGNQIGVAVLTPLWVLAAVALSIWAARQRAAIRELKWIHVSVLGAWGALWALTVSVGVTRFPNQPGWWLAGGGAMALAALTGAAVAARKTR